MLLSEAVFISQESGVSISFPNLEIDIRGWKEKRTGPQWLLCLVM